MTRSTLALVAVTACLLLESGPADAGPTNPTASSSSAGSSAGMRLDQLKLRIVGRPSPEAPWTDRPTEARADDGAELAVVLLARERRPGKKPRRVVFMDDLGDVVLHRRQVRPAMIRPWSELEATLGPVELRWSAIEPHAWRREGVKARNGTSTRFHSNVSLDPDTYGAWLGYDEIEYFATELGPWSRSPSRRRQPASARPPRPVDDIHDGLGTMRYQVEARLADGRELATAGTDASDRAGILPSVHRVSLRRDDTFLGYLTSYFMVPEVFGSAGVGRNHQTERFTGADCADVLTGALRRAGHSRVWHTSVAGLTQYTRWVNRGATLSGDGAVTSDDGGEFPEGEIAIQPGDIIRIDYGGSMAAKAPRAWDHVAALYRDRSDPDGPHAGGPDGVLDGFDLIVHMGHPHLVVEPLQSQGPARIDVLRWSPKKLGRRQ